MKTIVPEGYKKTKVGIYPDDWKEIEVSKYVIDKKKFCNNDDIPLYSLTIEEGVVPKSQRYERSHLVKDNEDAYKYVEYGDFVYNPMNLRFGALAVHDEQKEVKVSAYYDVFGIKNDKVNLEYLYAYLKSERIMFYYNRMATGSLEEKKRVHYKEFKKFKFPMPLLKEQEKIAQILTTCDEVITKQEELIKEKEQLKKGLMQKLLSGEVRFGGFNYEWQEVKLGKIFTERTTKAGNDEYELLSVTMANGVVRREEIGTKDNSSDDKSNYKQVKINDIAYNTMRMWQGASGVSKYNGIVSPAYTIVYLKKDYDIDFFGYLFKTHRVVFDFYRYSQGLTSDTWNIKYPHFSEVKVKIPTNKEEQSKIVEVLKKLEEEINLLKNELEELKLQKKALMQKLLTGQVRVKV